MARYRLPANFRTEAAAPRRKKVRRSKPKPYTLPKSFSTEAAQGGHERKRPSRPAPKSQPGPFTDKERKKVRRHKKTKQYKKAIKVARRSRKRAEKVRAARETLAFLRATRKAYDNNPVHRLSTAGFDPSDILGDAAKKGGSVALDVLEETTRPVHALAGTARSAIKNPWDKGAAQRAFVKGLKNEEKYTFSDVLKELGAPKIVQSVGGFTLDVFADPTTYVTFGTASVAKQAALKEAERVFNKAVAKGMTKEGATNAAKTAARRKAAQIAKEGRDNKGLTVGVGRHRTSGKTTAAISRKLGVSQTAKRVRGSKAVQTAGENLRPGFRPKGAAEGAHTTVRRAERKHRATAQAGQKQSQNRALAYKKELSKEDYQRVIDALEAGSLKGLPENLRKVAVQMRSDFRYMHRLEKRAGIAGGDLSGATRGAATKGYFPRIPAHALEPGAPKPKTSAANLASSKTRKTKGKTHKELRDEDPSLFSDDVPLVFGARATSSAKGVSKANYLQAVAKSGRKLTDDAPIDTETEWAYKVTATSITKFDSMDDALKAARRGERVMILNKAVADRALKQVHRSDDAMAKLGRFWDRSLQGRVKTILTVPNPQYHFTNLYGDLFNAYLADTGLRSLAKSAGAMRRLAKREAARRTLGKQLDPTSKGIAVGGKRLTYDDLILEAEEHGAIRTGFIGRDLPEVLDAQAKEYAERLGKGRFGRKLGEKGQAALRTPVGRAVAHPIDTIRDLSAYREDFVRLGTYIEGRKKGLSPEDAADKVAKHHFDYGDLTEFERGVLRRVFPFYTFTARNTPLQVETLLSKPGKYANLEKAREEFAKAAGLEPGWEDKLQDYEKRGLPFPLPLKDSLGQPLLLYPKLPAMDLGRLTVNPQEQARYVAAMVTPLLKAPAELIFDFNLFFGEPITNPDAPLVPAPDGVGGLPKAVRDKLGVKRIIDKRSGEKVWGWPAKMDYVARLTPLSATAIQMGTEAKNRQGQDKWLKLFGYGTGLKVAPLDKYKRALSDAFEKRAELYVERASLLQQGIAHDKNGDPKGRYRKVLDNIYKLNERIYRLKKKSGYKILPTTGAAADDKSPLDRIDAALGESDDSALDRIDKALGSPSTGALDRIDKALGR